MQTEGKKWRDIAVSFRYEKDLLIRWLRQSAGQKKRSTVYILILALLAVNFIFIIPTTQNIVFPLVMSLLCLGGIGFILLTRRGKSGARMVENLYHGGDEYRVFLRADEMVYRCAGEETVFPYGGKLRVLEHNDFFALHDGKERMFILPKQIVGEAQSEELANYYRERLGKDYKRCNR